MDENKVLELHSRWNDLWEELLQLHFPLDEFKPLFLETRQYYIELANHGTMHNQDLYPYMVMAKILGHNCYPMGTRSWEYDAAMQYIEGLLNDIASGQIALQFADDPVSFEEDFAKLCNTLGENYDFDDGQDID